MSFSVGNSFIKLDRSARSFKSNCHYVKVVGRFHLLFALTPFCLPLIRFCSGLHDGGVGREPRGKRKVSSLVIS